MSVLLRILAWTLAVSLALLPIIGVLNGWLAAHRWPIEELVVHAQYRRVDEAAIREAVLPHAARGFFAVDLDAVKAAVATLDWVASVEVRKRWPNRLELTVHEHEPYGQWGDEHLVSARGQLFAIPSNGPPPGLPRFEGQSSRLEEIISVYSAAEPLLALHGETLHTVRLSARGSWSFRLDGGATLMAGRGDPLPRLQRFVPLLIDVLRADSRPLLRADLRYGNGFALRWDEAAAAPPSAAGTKNNGSGV